MRHETRVVMSRIVCSCGWSTAFGWSAQEQREGMERAQAHKSESGSTSYTVAIGMLLAGIAYIAAHVVVWAWSLADAVGRGM